MPFNGTGMFVRVRNWVADATAGIRIRADYHDIEDDGFADGLSHCIARDGQTTILNNIPMNSKRITALADPADPQDASTKAYTDTKLPLAGGTITGDLTVTGSLTAGLMTAVGYRTRAGLAGPAGGNWFNFNWTSSNLEVWVDNYNFGNLATQSYVEQRASDWAHAVADPKVNRAGDTMTGPLTVNGEFVVSASYVRFGTAGSAGYIQWNGGSSYALGGAGNIWHTVNLAPVTDGRLASLGQTFIALGGTADVPNGAVMVGANTTGTGQLQYLRYRYLQLLVPSGWYTVGVA